ncbi:MAG TPA: hypothetical protein VJC39_04360 [Candidatus Nanoarchaeia archaeon]|nr:hypothetical protein [Candidatus Nanoarchaeia archaeon]
MVSKINYVILTALLVLLSVSLVSAAVTVETADLKKVVNYESLEDNDDEMAVSYSISLTNSGTTNESLSLSLQNLAAGYDLTVTPSILQLAAGVSQDITVSGNIPVDEDQGIHTVGKLKVTSASGDGLYDLQTDVESMVDIKRIYVYVNGNLEDKVTSSQDKVKDLKPGDEIELRFEIENLFDNNYDEGDLEGEITLTLDDSDFGDDEIDESENFDLQAGDSTSEKDLVFAFQIPEEAEEADYTLDLKLEAEDGNTASYDLDWEMDLEVQREKDDIRVAELEVYPLELSCTLDQEVKVSVRVVNYGSDRQRDSALTVVNSDLSLNQKFEFELERGDSNNNYFTKDYSFTIGKELKVGTYPITATAFINHDEVMDKEIVQLTIKKCLVVEPAVEAEEVENNTGSSADGIPSSTSGKNTDKISSSAVVRTFEDPYTSEDVFIAILVAVFVLVLAMIVVFAIILLRR